MAFAMKKPVLAGLEKIDWKTLRAPEIPKWLRDLASDDRKIQLQAYHNIEDSVVHIGATSWENYGPLSEILKTDIPHLIVPFLIELLEHKEVKNKVWILQLLYDLAWNMRLHINEVDDPFRTRAHQVYDAVQAGVETYESLLHDRSPDTRGLASDLLSVFNWDG
jgi:hypothetical protein